MQNFWELPWVYVLDAINNGRLTRHRQLHENEVPITFLAWQQAELNRDRKKNKRPHELADFFVYPDDRKTDSIDAVYGAAALALIEQRKFPSWALFVYHHLKKNAEKSTPPEVLCYQNDNCLVLAPQVIEGCLKGLLIAKYETSETVQVLLTNIPGEGIKIKVPKLDGEVAAIENCYLDVIATGVVVNGSI